MRIIDSIPHESMTISIFQMNDKLMVKFEAGPMEQVFKFHMEDVKSVANLKQMINPQFVEETRARFNEMFKQLRAVQHGL